MKSETARLRIQFLDRELDLTATMIALTRLEAQVEGEARASQALQHVCHGLVTIRRFLGQVNSPKDHARIAGRLKQLEAEAATLATNLGLQMSE